MQGDLFTGAIESAIPVLHIDANYSGPVRGYSYLWLKYVRGFKPTECCAKCFIGHHSRRLWITTHVNVAITLDEPEQPYDYIYLCGVSRMFRHSENLHLPVRVKEGAEAEVVSYDGETRFRIANAEPVLPIPELPASWPVRITGEQRKCRNYQFAASIYGPGSAATKQPPRELYG